jgi:hypothetical protein
MRVILDSELCCGHGPGRELADGGVFHPINGRCARSRVLIASRVGAYVLAEITDRFLATVAGRTREAR